MAKGTSGTRNIKTTADRLAAVAVKAASTAPQLQDKLEYTSNVTSRQYFMENAKPLDLVVGGVPMMAEIKEFKESGSFGWFTQCACIYRLADEKDAVKGTTDGGDGTFVNQARSIEIDIGGRKMTAFATLSSQGTCLWNVSYKTDLPCGSHKVMCQIGLNLWIPKTKDEFMDATGKINGKGMATGNVIITVIDSKTGAGRSC